MKFLVDANLPPRLCVWLRSHRHEAEHLFDCDLLAATDTQIWERASIENLAIFSKDVTSTTGRCSLALHRKLFMSRLAIVAILDFSRCWRMNGMTSSGRLYLDRD